VSRISGGGIVSSPNETGNDRHALVVDQHPLVRATLKSLLSKAGFSVMESDDGRCALSIATKGRCFDPMCSCSPSASRALLIADSPRYLDLLVSETQPPGIDGWELATSYLHTHPRGRVVMLSGNSGEEVISINSESPGTWRFIPKSRIADLPDAILAAGFMQPKRLILLVEDEPMVRNVVQTVLDKAGFASLTAADGERALELSRAYAGNIDLVLSDVEMPRVNGIQLAEQIQRERPGTPVLLMSGFSPSALPSHTMLVAKPLDFRALILRIERLLAARQS
jgi:CheY-like chemotaxis protein